MMDEDLFFQRLMLFNKLPELEVFGQLFQRLSDNAAAFIIEKLVYVIADKLLDDPVDFKDACFFIDEDGFSDWAAVKDANANVLKIPCFGTDEIPLFRNIPGGEDTGVYDLISKVISNTPGFAITSYNAECYSPWEETAIQEWYLAYCATNDKDESEVSIEGWFEDNVTFEDYCDLISDQEFLEFLGLDKFFGELTSESHVFVENLKMDYFMAPALMENFGCAGFGIFISSSSLYQFSKWLETIHGPLTKDVYMSLAPYLNAISRSIEVLDCGFSSMRVYRVSSSDKILWQYMGNDIEYKNFIGDYIGDITEVFPQFLIAPRLIASALDCLDRKYHFLNEQFGNGGECSCT